MLNDSISNIRIDINGESARSGIYVRQGDTKSRSIHISLVDHGQVISLENAIVAELLIAKTDGFECDQGMVIVGNELQYTFRTNDLSALGANKAQVMVTFDDGAVLTSPEFTINVYAKEVNQKYQESFNEYTALTQNVALASQYAKQAENSADKAESYESTFKTMRDEAVTASANASASATSASESATTASGASAEAAACRDVCLEAKADALSSKNQANLYMIATEGYADQAIEASATASQSQIQAKSSENNASSSASSAATSEHNAKVSESKADEYQQQAKEYLDEMAELQETIDALDAAIETKADVTALNNHVNDTDIHVTLQDRAKWDAITALEQRISTLESMIGYPINPS